MSDLPCLQRPHLLAYLSSDGHTSPPALFFFFKNVLSILAPYNSRGILESSFLFLKRTIGILNGGFKESADHFGEYYLCR